MLYIEKINLKSLFESFSKINILINESAEHSKIVTETDNNELIDYTQNDLNKYKSFLYLIADEIFDKLKKDNIFVEYDVITNLFFIKKENSKFVKKYEKYCNYCPCLHCVPDDKLFEKLFNTNKPLENFCKKSFIEKEVSLYLLNKLKEINDMKNCYDISNISYSDFIKFIKKINKEEENA